MPLPHVNPNESDDAFISRCAGDAVMNKDYPDNPQRLAVCYSILKRHKKDAKASVPWEKTDQGIRITHLPDLAAKPESGTPAA